MDVLLHNLPRGNGQQGQTPASAFETGENILNTPSLQFDSGKIFLGLLGAQLFEKRHKSGYMERFCRGGQPIGVEDDRHIITIAGSRSGKGRCAIIPNLLTYTGSVLATDPKAELADITARWRAKGLKQTVYVVDPFGAASESTRKFRTCFNPLDTLDPNSDTIVEDAGLISDALVVTGEGSDPHWDESARNFIEGVILHVATHPQYSDKRDLVTVRDLVMGQNSNLQEEMETNTAAYNAIADASRDFFDKPDRERESVISTARRHLRFLTYRSIQTALRGNSINLRDLKTKRMTVYLCLPAMHMGTCYRFFRLFVNLTLAAMEKEKTKPALPALLCLDEFAVMRKMQSIEDAAGQIAGLGVKLWPILQDLGQLKALYADRWETFLGNAGVIQCFGNSELSTLEWVSKRLGPTTILTESHSEITYQARAAQGATGKSSASQVHDLMTPEELSRYFGRDDPLRRQLIIRPGYRPMILQRANYDTHELFQGKFDVIQGNGKGTPS